MITECPNCKSPVARSDQRFCYQCGRPLPEEALPDLGSAGVSGQDNEPPKTEVLKLDEIPIGKARFRILLPTGDGFDRELGPGEIKLGKGPRNDIVIADPAVSSSHAMVLANNDGYTISDLGSRNGTFVNSQRVTEPQRLSHGDVVSIGRSRLTFKLSTHSDTDTIGPADTSASIPPLTEASLEQAVIAAGLASNEQIRQLKSKLSGTGRLYRLLIDERLATPEQLRDLMSRTFRIPTIDLRGLEVEENVISKVPARLAIDLQALPVAQSDGRLTFAVADPTDTELVRSLTGELRVPVEIKLATPDEISGQIHRHYGPKLVGVLPTGEKLEYSVTQSEVKIGKASHNNIILADPTVSNSHAIILARGDAYNIVDLDSRNGTFVGGERLGADSRALRHGDNIQLGKTILVFRNPAETSEHITMTLSDEMLSEVRSRAKLEGSEESAAAAVHQAGAAPAQDTAGSAEEKKKKKKKKEGERLKAAYIGAVSRILAQVAGVLAAVVVAIVITSKMSGPNKVAVDVEEKPGALLTNPAGATRIDGGPFEASGVIQVPAADGQLLIADNERAGQVVSMYIDQFGNQQGKAEALSLGANLQDPEAITYGGGYFYILGSQSNPGSSALIRFEFNAATRSVVEPVEVLANLRDYLVANVPEIGDGSALNVEGIAWDPVGERILLGLRSPLTNGKALIIPLKLSNARGPFSVENLARPEAIALPLEGLGIRDICYDKRLRLFLIIAGGSDQNDRADFKLWAWDGDSSKIEVKLLDVTLDRGMKPEGITSVTVGDREFMFIVGDQSRYTKLDYATGQ